MLLKYLFILTLIILFVPPIRRFVFYLLVGRKLVSQQRQREDAFMRRQQQDGQTRVDSRPQPHDTRFEGGEYVDYEEVK